MAKQNILKVKFISYSAMRELFNNYSPINIDGNVMYKLSGGDDWRAVTFENFHYRSSNDTCNHFIYDDNNDKFYILKEDYYDRLLASENHKQYFEELIHSAVASGTFVSYNGKNKAKGMQINEYDEDYFHRFMTNNI